MHWDDVLPGFGVRVTKTGVKSYILQRRIKGRDKRITLGRHGVLTAEQARKEATKLLGQIITGHDPVAEKHNRKLKSVTLIELFETYIGTRKTLKPRTLADMHDTLKQLPDWKDKPFTNITGDMVLAQHSKIGEKSPS